VANDGKCCDASIKDDTTCGFEVRGALCTLFRGTSCTLAPSSRRLSEGAKGPPDSTHLKTPRSLPPPSSPPPLIDQNGDPDGPGQNPERRDKRLSGLEVWQTALIVTCLIILLLCCCIVCYLHRRRRRWHPLTNNHHIEAASPHTPGSASGEGTPSRFKSRLKTPRTDGSSSDLEDTLRSPVLKTPRSDTRIIGDHEEVDDGSWSVLDAAEARPARSSRASRRDRSPWRERLRFSWGGYPEGRVMRV